MEKIEDELSSEWVGAPAARTLCERKKARAEETITPSDRVH